MPSKLSPNDANVLEKIQDPESPAVRILVDPSLPKDPNVTEPDTYDAAVAGEQGIMHDVLALQRKEFDHLRTMPKYSDSIHPSESERLFRTYMFANWLSIITRMDNLIERFPDFASARNNRVQALRMVYGDGLLVKLYVEDEKSSQSGRLCHVVPDGLPALETSTMDQDLFLEQVSRKVLGDLTRGIALLSPKTIFSGVSPTQATNLANLYMQRGQLYRVAAEKLAKDGVSVETITTVDGVRFEDTKLRAEFRVRTFTKEGSWSSLDFQENASRDFMMAGRFGNEIGKALAVAMNPTAKLCGEMVKEAMRKEFAGGEMGTTKGNVEENTPGNADASMS